MSDVEKSTDAAGAESPVVQPKPGKNPFVIAVMAIAVVAVLSVAYTFSGSLMGERVSGGTSKFVVIDTQRILMAASAQAIKPGIEVDAKAIGEFGTAFAKKLSEEIHTYAQQGYVVLDGQMVIESPEDTNKTQEVANKLGVKL